ncbi:AraC family transcriptional regulator [Oscillibacter valericigenes]|jgi:AraC-like DNA-binding protein|uniref:helix-turn-helix transcriptional regulator n=1 Tax=Oscillibacter ruminantium TaxID=1263547 RepID=UPI00031845FE|nr:AraC family transcriptional regulator [Oscillibacter ruminantium]MDN0033896.1 AraC family transcriptional regulator [Oscillibacter valericigenes]MEA5041110.1 AraC family transcriptional regulator [Oscillibacter ruminantium]
MQLDFDIKRNLHKFQDLTEPHCHDLLEILVCLADGGKFISGDEKLPLYCGTVHIVKKGVLHHCLVEVSSYERYIIHISYETLWLLSSQQTDLISIFNHANPYIILNEEELGELSELIEQSLHQAPELGMDFEQNILLMRIILYIVRHLCSHEAEVKEGSSREFLKIMPIINYIHDNYSEEISLDQISREFFISKYYLCRLFKGTTGFSVGGYIINYRVRQACLLLREGASVQEAGENVGFGNNANFIRTFKRIIGVTPGKYAQH